MQLKKAILPVFLFAVYSVVLIHNFIPHDHHADYTGCTENCDTHNEILYQSSQTSLHCHSSNYHLHCHFSVKLVLSKMASFAGFHTTSKTMVLADVGQKSNRLPGFYPIEKTAPPQIYSKPLRAPPSFV